jgi:hypothetical protein
VNTFLMSEWGRKELHSMNPAALRLEGRLGRWDYLENNARNSGKYETEAQINGFSSSESP